MIDEQPLVVYQGRIASLRRPPIRMEYEPDQITVTVHYGNLLHSGHIAFKVSADDADKYRIGQAVRIVVTTDD